MGDRFAGSNAPAGGDKYARPYSRFSTRVPNKARPISHRKSPNTSGTWNRSSSLVPQKDLFHKCKSEVDDDHPNALRRPQNSPRVDTWSNKTKNAEEYRHKSYDDQNYLGVHRSESRTPYNRPSKDKRGISSARNGGTFQTNKGDPRLRRTPIDKLAADSSPPLVSGDQKSAPAGGAGVPKQPVSVQQHAVLLEPSQKSERVGKLVDLFRRLAQCSNQVAQDIAAQDREQAKLQTFNQISLTLSSISPTAATAVTPALTNIILNHTRSQVQVEASLKALGDLWEDVFNIFVTEVVRVVDAKLEDALVKVNAECDRAVSVVAAGLSKAQRYDETKNSGSSPVVDWREGRKLHGLCPSDADSGSTPNKEERACKRRRLSSTPLNDPPVPNEDVDMVSSIEDILRQIKLRLDKQTNSAETLDKENRQLQATLQCQPSTGPFVFPSSVSLSQPCSVGSTSTPSQAFTRGR